MRTVPKHYKVIDISTIAFDLSKRIFNDKAMRISPKDIEYIIKELKNYIEDNLKEDPETVIKIKDFIDVFTISRYNTGRVAYCRLNRNFKERIKKHFSEDFINKENKNIKKIYEEEYERLKDLFDN